MTTSEVSPHQSICRAVISALGRQSSSISHEDALPHPAGDPPHPEKLRQAAAVVLRVSEAELTEGWMQAYLERITSSAAEDASRVAHVLNERIQYLKFLGCGANHEIEEFFRCADAVLGELYRAVACPAPSPTQLLRLALQYALDPRRPIKGDMRRFELRRKSVEERWCWEIVEYPSCAEKIPAISLSGQIVSEPSAVRLLQLLHADPPQIYRLMEFVEKCLGESPLESDRRSFHSARECEAKLQLNQDELSITINGKSYVVDAPEFHLVRILVEADGVWVSSVELQNRSPLVGMRPDRLRKKLPKVIRDLLESAPGKGTRIRTERLA